MKEFKIKNNHTTMTFPKIILGTTMFGTSISEKTAFALMDEYANLGGFCIDTAHVYGDWEDLGEPLSERTVGKWLKQSSYKSKFRIITKGAHYKIKTPGISRVTAACIEEDINKSLKSLQVDTIDLYFLHRDNPDIPVSELMPVLHKYVSSGKIKMLGASNWTADRIFEANKFARENNLTPFSASQVKWSLAIATPGKNVNPVETLPVMDTSEYEKYMSMELPALAYSSQASGVISKVIENGWDNINQQLKDVYYNDTNIRRIEHVKELMDRRNISATQAALSYITCNRLQGAALIGPSGPEHLRDSMTAADVEIEQSDIDALIH